VIEVAHLTKRYGQRLAVDDLSFKVDDGEVVGFLGPNGAGKSTTMNILTGYLSATQGTVSVNGHDVLKEPEAAKKQIGYMPEVPPLYLDMTVADYLRFAAGLKGIPRAKRAAEAARVMELVRITDMARRVIRNLSKGYRQRVGLAQALAADPSILILDEPTIGLDPQQIIEVRTLVRSMGKGRTVILSSHILSEVAAVCSRVLIISRGRIVASDTPQNLSRGTTGSNFLQVRVRGAEKPVLEAVTGCAQVRRAEVQAAREPGAVDLVVEAREGQDVRDDLFAVLAKAGLPIRMMKMQDPGLEEAFLHLTTDGKGAG